MNKIVSVIVPCYNCQQHVEKCIKSLLNQTYKKIEIILIDDGSTDKTNEICNRYAKESNNVVLKKIKNGGPSHARNVGLSLSKGDYILFVDSDDWLDESTIEIMVNKAADEELDCVVCNYMKVGNKNKTINKEYKKYDRFIEFFSYNFCWMVWGKLYKKSIIKNVFNEKYFIGEDLLFLYENHTNISKYGYINEPLYMYYINESSLMNNKKISQKDIQSLEVYDLLSHDNNKDISIFYHIAYIDTVTNIMLKGSAARNTIKKNTNIMNVVVEKYKLIMSSNISIKNKIKLFIKVKCYGVYKLIKK